MFVPDFKTGASLIKTGTGGISSNSGSNSSVSACSLPFCTGRSTGIDEVSDVNGGVVVRNGKNRRSSSHLSGENLKFVILKAVFFIIPVQRLKLLGTTFR